MEELEDGLDVLKILEKAYEILRSDWSSDVCSSDLDYIRMSS